MPCYSFDPSKRKTSTYVSSVIRRNFDQHHSFGVRRREHQYRSCDMASWRHGLRR